MNTIIIRGSRRVATATAVALALLLVAATISFATSGKDKVGVCHRTNSDTNPYVYIKVPATEANGHITGTDKSHNDQGRWKSDGTWRGVTHKAGDEKHDYFAQSKADCDDLTTGGTTSGTTTKPPTTTGTTGTTSGTTTGTTTSGTTSPTTTTASSSPTTTAGPSTSTPSSMSTTSLTSSSGKPPVKKPTRTWTPRATSSPTSSQPGELAYTGAGEALALIAIIGLALLGVGYAATRYNNRRKY